jgi:hypothetical protein
MFRRLFACSLIVLIVVPCAAPFPTCPLSDLLNRTEHGKAAAPIRPANAAVEDGSACLLPTLVTPSKRIEPDALPAARSGTWVEETFSPHRESVWLTTGRDHLASYATPLRL